MDPNLAAPQANPSQGAPPTGAAPQGPMPPPDYDPSSVDAGKTWAFLSYASLFIGFPICIVPLIQKDNAFALYHSKHACAAVIVQYVLGAIVGVFAVVTCGFGAIAIPIVFLPMISAIHGLVIVNSGEWREPVLLFGIGEKLFGSLRAVTRANPGR